MLFFENPTRQFATMAIVWAHSEKKLSFVNWKTFEKEIRCNTKLNEFMISDIKTFLS